MQDAAVVVNYDIAWTPIEPIQRAGRILRLWEEFRTVKIYTFIPIISKIPELEKEVLQIERRWQNLMKRHKESRKIIDLPVITADREQEVNMPDFASDVNVEKGILSFDNVDDIDISIFYQHMQNLHLHREEAEKLHNDLVSAMNYEGKIHCFICF